MANFKALPIAAAVATALVAMSASAVEFHGYFRAGFGLNADGGSQVCYGNGGPAAHAVGRLADECDTYGELALSETVYEKNGEAFSVHTLMALGTPGNTNRDSTGNYRGNSWQGVSDGNGDPWTGQRFSFREAYGKYKMAGGTELWAGNRYYGRKDVHIWDLYYVNASGYGAGVDNIKAGPGAIAVSVRELKWGTWGFTDADSTQPYVSTPVLDLRYNGLQLGAIGNLDLIVMAGEANYSDLQEEAIKDTGSYSDETAYNLTAELSTPVLGGFNKVVAQYSQGGFAWTTYGFNNHLGDAVLANAENDDRTTWRLIDHGMIKLGKQVQLGYGLLYSELDQDGQDKNGVRYGVTIRPQFMWNDTMSTILEAGYYNHEDPWEAEARDLNKIALAQAWSPLQNGGFWARPQLRVFVAQYGGDDKIEDADTMVGAQVEAWW